MLRTVLIHYDGNRALSKSVIGEANKSKEGTIEGLSVGIIVDSVSTNIWF